MPPIQLSQNSIYLQPGKVYIGNEPVVVTTVLGSCIAVTLRHPATGLTAICHALQPICPEPGCDGLCPDNPRFARCVVLRMAAAFIDRHIPTHQLEVKLFGGGVLMGNSGPIPVGRLNIEAACQALKQCGLSLNAVEVGGQWGRKIIFDTTSGAVWVKRLVRKGETLIDHTAAQVAAGLGR